MTRATESHTAGGAEHESAALPSPGEAARGWAGAVVDLLYPPVCALCSRGLLPAEKTICLVCRAALNPEPEWRCARCGAAGLGRAPEGAAPCRLCPPPGSVYQGVLAVTGYFAESARAVHLFKYDRRLEIGRALAELMRGRLGESIRHLGARLDVIAPVPLHWARRAGRGFNQSTLLAKGLAAEAGLPLDTRLLRRARYTRRQALVPHEKRAANVRNAFAVRGGRDVRGKGILLIDDVVTTGNTVQECARVLRTANAREVWVACFARTGMGAPDSIQAN